MIEIVEGLRQNDDAVLRGHLRAEVFVPEPCKSFFRGKAFAAVALIVGTFDGGLSFRVEFLDRLPFQRLQGGANQIVGRIIIAVTHPLLEKPLRLRAQGEIHR